MKKPVTKRSLCLITALIAAAALFTACGTETDSPTPAPSSQTAVSSTEASEPAGSSEPADSSEPAESSEPTESTPEAPSEPAKPSEPQTPSAGDTGLVATAKEMLGKPFAKNGSTPEQGFDNSGFLYYAAKANGYTFPRFLSEQVKADTAVTAFTDLQPGDIAYFWDSEEGTAQIGGIVIEDNKMIICTKPGEDVHEKNLSSYWREHFVTAVRLG